MNFFKKLPIFTSLSTLSLILTLGIHELQAADSASIDPNAELLGKYPLTEEGGLTLLEEARKTYDETLLDEVLSRFETKQLTLDDDERNEFCYNFDRIAKKYTSPGTSECDFAKAARWYLRAEKFGDPKARENYEGLLEIVESIRSTSSCPKDVQRENLVGCYLNDARKSDVEFLKKVAKGGDRGKKGNEIAHYGIALACYHKMIALGIPEGETLLLDTFKNFKELSSDDKADQAMDVAFDYFKKERAVEEITQFITYKDVGTENRKEINWEELTAIDALQLACVQPSLYAHPQQSPIVKTSPFGKMLASLEQAVSSLSQIKLDDLKLSKPGLLVTAVTVKQAIPGFIETFDLDGSTYVSIGKVNCINAKLLQDALKLYRSTEANLNEVLGICRQAIQANVPKLIALSALAIGDETKAKKFGQLSSAQDRLKNELARLEAYNKAGVALNVFFTKAPHRDAKFYARGEFDFIK